MKRVVPNGKCKDAQLATYLQVGRVYEVVSEKKVGEKTKFILKGIPKQCEYDEDWFKILPVDTVFSKKIPIIDEVMTGLSTMDRGRLTTADIEVKPLEIHHIGGNVYEVYAQYRNYIVIVL